MDASEICNELLQFANKKKRLTSISGDKIGARVSPHTAENYESEKMLSIIRECQSNYSEVLAHVC